MSSYAGWFQGCGRLGCFLLLGKTFGFEEKKLILKGFLKNLQSILIFQTIYSLISKIKLRICI